jgi:subtilisin family serine protease
MARRAALGVALLVVLAAAPVTPAPAASPAGAGVDPVVGSPGGTSATAGTATENGTASDGDEESSGGNDTVSPARFPTEPDDLRDPFAAGRLSTDTAPDGRATLVVEATGAGAVNETALHVAGSEVVGRHGRFVEIHAAPGRADRIRSLPWVRLVRRPHPASGAAAASGAASATTSEGVAVVGADEVHEAGITGENVTVGVIDTGFRPGSPELAGRVASARSFRIGGITRFSTHGTAVAELVVDVAPNATLYLGTFGSVVGYRNAAEWLDEQDVDVVVTSIGFYTQPGDGGGPISKTATGTVGRGTVWVNAAGNAAGDHWEGEFADDNGDGVHEFAPGDELNELNGGRALRAGSVASVVLEWDDWPTSDRDYDLALFRVTDDGREVVSSSTIRQDGARAPFETVSHRVPRDGVYAFAVRRVDAPGDATLEAFVTYRGVRAEPLEHDTPASSVLAPATARGVVGVGAFDVRDGRLEPFSSRGPTDDGRLGVDVIAPNRVTTRAYSRPFTGTSAAAPHVAGVAALLLSADRSLSPAAVSRLLRRTATDVGPAGIDEATGGGRVNALAAVEAATGERGRPPDVTGDGRPAGDPDGDGRYEDVDGDGAVTPADATVLFEAVLDGDAALAADPAAFDFTGDGAVTPADATVLFREIV